MKAIRFLCIVYTAALGVAVFIDLILAITTVYGTTAGVGCNWGDALIVGIGCHGFPLQHKVEFFLNLPLFYLYLVILSFSNIWLALFTIIIWLPILYLLIHWARRNTVKTSGLAGNVNEKSGSA